MGLNGDSLDRWITGNYGEDNVPSEFEEKPTSSEDLHTEEELNVSCSIQKTTGNQDVR